MRIDKWLWVARFYRTRTVAQTALLGGKIRCNGDRVKPSKIIDIGDNILIKGINAVKEIKIQAISSVRLNATKAEELYQVVSIEKKETNFISNKSVESRRPTKKERRALLKLKKG